MGDAELAKYAARTLYAYVVVHSDLDSPVRGNVVIEKKKKSNKIELFQNERTGVFGTVKLHFICEGEIADGKFVPREPEKHAFDFIIEGCKAIEANRAPFPRTEPPITETPN